MRQAHERIPDWAIQFHTHLCPCLVIGYRMGCAALDWLRIDRNHGRGLLILPELGEGHPQTCMVDGMRIATGATYGQLLVAKTHYSKLAATFYYPERGAIRYALRPEFVDESESFAFYSYRRQCKDVGDIPQVLVDELLTWIDSQPDAAIFTNKIVVGFPYRVVAHTFNKARCAACGEYVLVGALQTHDERRYCISCFRERTTAPV